MKEIAQCWAIVGTDGKILELPVGKRRGLYDLKWMAEKMLRQQRNKFEETRGLSPEWQKCHEDNVAFYDSFKVRKVMLMVEDEHTDETI